MAVSVLGIRHHGPGSARSVLRALDALKPDAILVEGPPDADYLIPLLAHDEMRPPVALLIHAQEDLQKAVYYPFAVFSPEYQALLYGIRSGVPVRFIDLPPSHRLALDPSISDAAMEEEIDKIEGPEEGDIQTSALVRDDPLRFVAEAAGFTDSERWWEQMVEQRLDATGLFQAILEMMAALRESLSDSDPIEMKREAWMRRSIRMAEKEGLSNIAVVCGAWHAPALETKGPAAADAALLSGLPRLRVSATWVPWTYDRLSYWSGYGAGIHSPGYYELLFERPRDVVTRWTARAGHLLRQEDLDASPASMIETVRLADALASMRGRALAGLPELMESARSVLCHGSDAPLDLISRKLVVGIKLGEVPEVTPMVPLQKDLNRAQKRLRLPAEASERVCDLDLRNPNDLDRSRLLHRLNLLGVPWGVIERASGKAGTFHEYWRLRWDPDLTIRVIEASVWGSTVESAGSSRAIDRAIRADSLPHLTAVLEASILADLPDAVEHAVGSLDRMAAVSGDIPHLMESLTPLANVARYGSVRGADSGVVRHVVDGVIARVCIGLAPACASLNDEAAAAMFDRIQAVHHAVSLFDSEEYRGEWTGALIALAGLAGANGLLTGRAVRLLMDTGVWEPSEVGRRMALAISRAEEPARAGAWIEGFLRGSGLLLLHHHDLWSILDAWLTGLGPDDFVVLLPLLRRTFSTFPAAERRQMGQRAVSGMSAAAPSRELDLDVERAARVLPTVAALLGLKYPGEVAQS